MVLVRLVSSEHESEELLTLKALRQLQILNWQDPQIDEILKALSHEGKICPVIQAWREKVPASFF